MSEYTVTVAGATGKTGRHVIEMAMANGWRTRAASRRPVPRAEWARFDWDAEDTWAPAFSGSDAAYLLIPYRHPGAPEKTPDLLEAVAAAGVTRIVFLSTLDAENAAPDDPSRAAELKLEGLPVRSAILRPTWFMENFTAGAFASMTAAGDLRLPAGDGRIPFIACRDIAAVAVAALAADGASGILPLTGPAALSHDDVAEELSRALDRPVSHSAVASDEFSAAMTAQGFSLEYATFLADALTDVGNGRLRIPVHETVRQVLGRPAHSFAEFARGYAGDTEG